MAPEVKKKAPAVVADYYTGDIFHIVPVVTGKELDASFAFADRKPFLKMVGAERGGEIVPLWCRVNGLFTINDKTADGGHLTQPIVLIVRIVAAGETGGEQKAGIDAVFVVLQGVVFLVELVQVSRLGAGREGDQDQQGKG
jgi:hypothetical protein